MTIEVYVRSRFRADGVFASELDGAWSGRVDDETVISVERIDGSRQVDVVVTHRVGRPPDEIAELLTQWWPQIAAEVRVYSALDDDDRGDFEMGAALALWIAPPVDLAEFLDGAHRELRLRVQRVAGLLAWRLYLPELTARPFRPVIEWSVDQREWVADLYEEGGISAIGPIVVSTDAPSDLIEEALGSGPEREPLGHELLAEAVSVGHGSPRSALIHALTAAEVGVRSFVSSRGRPDVAWLLSQPQAPPLDALLAHYLAFCTERRTKAGHVLPRGLRKTIREGVESRNKVVHMGEPPPSNYTLHQLLSAVGDLLYILDWFDGNEWALDHVSTEHSDEYRTANDFE